MGANGRLVKDDGRHTHSECCSPKEDEEWRSFKGEAYSSVDPIQCKSLSRCLINHPNKEEL